MESKQSPFILDTFTPLVGEKFRTVTDTGETIELHLVEAETIGLHKRDGRTRDKTNTLRKDPFSLIFSFNRMLSQGLYSLHNDALGDVEIFLVPIGPFDGNWGHEAVFN